MNAFGQQLRIMAGFLIGALAIAAHPAAAQTAARVPIPPEGEAAFAKREYGKAAGIIVPAFENCRVAHPQGDACATLAAAVAVLVATAGNDKVEGTILRALDYVEMQVGPESQDALMILSALATYYDRLQDMNKYLPVAQRRLAVSRKLYGATNRFAVSAAVALCVAQWNLGRGEDAITLLTPLAGKLPENTPEELVLSGRVHECIGTAYYSLDRHREAEGTFRKAAALFERAGGEGSALTLDAMAWLANTLRHLDRESEAKTIAARIPISPRRVLRSSNGSTGHQARRETRLAQPVPFWRAWRSNLAHILRRRRWPQRSSASR